MASRTLTPQCGSAPSTIGPDAHTRRAPEIPFMSAAKHPGIKLEQGGRYDWYTGPIDDFITAGFFTREQCPGQPGNPKTTSSFYRGVRRSPGAANCPHDEGYVTIRVIGRHRAEVRVGLKKGEAERRKAEKAREYAANEAAEKSRKSLEDMPSTHAAFRARTAGTMQAVLRMIPRTLAPTDWHGFSYDDETKAEIAELTEEIVTLLQRGGTCFNRKRHIHIATGHRAVIARADAKFSGVLSMLSTLSERAEEVMQ